MDAPNAENEDKGRYMMLRHLVTMADPDQERTIRRRALLRTVDVYDHRVVIDLTINDAFTCLCPFNENTDRANVTIHYRPNQSIVELASLRDYLQRAFIHEAITHEDVISLIWQDLMVVLGLASNNSEISVEMVFEPVEGVGMTIRKDTGYSSPMPPIFHLLRSAGKW